MNKLNQRDMRPRSSLLKPTDLYNAFQTALKSTSKLFKIATINFKLEVMQMNEIIAEKSQYIHWSASEV